MYRLRFRKSRARGQRGDVLLPGGDRIGPIEPAQSLAIALPQRVESADRRRRPGTPAPPTPSPPPQSPTSSCWFCEMCSRNGRMLREVGLLDRAGQIGRLVLQQIGVVGVDRQHRVAGVRRARPAPRETTTRTGRTSRAARGRTARAAAPRRPRTLRRTRAPARYALSVMWRTSGAASSDAPPLASGPDDQQPLARLQVERDPDGQLTVERQGVVEIDGHRCENSSGYLKLRPSCDEQAVPDQASGMSDVRAPGRRGVSRGPAGARGTEAFGPHGSAR